VLGDGPPRFKLRTTQMHPARACLKLKSEFVTKVCMKSLESLEACWLRSSEEDVSLHGGMMMFATTPYAKVESQSTAPSTFSMEEFSQADTFIFSFQGVLDKVVDITLEKSPEELQKEIVANVNKLIAKGKQVLIASNNSHYSRAEFAARVIDKGIKLPPTDAFKHILSTSYMCAWFLKNTGVKRPFVICSERGIIQELKKVGINSYVATVNEDGKAKQEYLQQATFENITKIVKDMGEVDAVVVGWDQQLTTLKMAVANALIRWSREGQLGSTADVSERQTHPIQVVTCSSDVRGILGMTPADYCNDRHYNNRTVTTIGNGLMSDIICRSYLDSFSAFDVGKPSELMLEALRRPASEDGFGVDLSKAVLIGDTIQTDIEMANRGGMKSVLVLSGVTSKAGNVKEDLRHVPTWVLNSFAEPNL